jgi:ribulose-phosphate 3-epimerase
VIVAGRPEPVAGSSRRDALVRTPPTALGAPSVLSADFTRLGEEIESVLAAGADLVHLDVMDGHFVPNLSMGPALCGSVRKRFPSLFLDVHLMVSDPLAFVGPFVDAGADLCSFHVEAADDPAAVAARIRETGALAGLAINPGTEVARVLPFVGAVDLVLVMSVQPGYAGQSFRSEVLAKCREIAPRLGPGQRLEIDGGVAPANAAACREAGCDVLVAASAIFGATDRTAVIRSLRGAPPVS